MGLINKIMFAPVNGKQMSSYSFLYQKVYDEIIEEPTKPEPSEGLAYTLNSDGVSYSVKKGACTDTNIVIASEYEGYPVTSIGYEAFKWCENLTSIVIPDSITSIGGSAFYHCSALTSITIPDSVTSVGNYAFYNCSSLTSITIPDSVTNIGDRVFYGCKSLTAVHINDIAALCNINYTTEYSHPAYCKYNLYLNGELVTGLTIPDSVTSIASYMFNDCSSLTSIIIGDSATSIGEWAFAHCENLTSITIPDSVTSIGGAACYNCTNLKHIIIPDNVTSIGNNAFYGCTSLTLYCEAESKPNDWAAGWNSSNRPIFWGYTGEEYTYNFVSNNGNDVEPIVSSLPIELCDTTREGWYFDGWYDNVELSGSALKSPYYSSTVHTLYAKWVTADEYFNGSTFKRAYSINSGETLPVIIDEAGEHVYFKFTATEDKTYIFKATGTDGSDSFGHLYDIDQNQISTDDDGAGNSHFLLSKEMAAGETVYIVARLYFSTHTGAYNLTVS